MEKKSNNYIRSTWSGQWEIETDGAFNGENILRVDTIDGSLRFQYIVRSQVINTAVLSIEEIFHYLPMILAHLNKQHVVLAPEDKS